MSDYASEVQSRFGDTPTYREYAKKTKGYTKEKWSEINDGLMAIFAEFSESKKRGSLVDCAEVQALVEKLKGYISANYYTCTNDILKGLGQMYVMDDRFRQNIDTYGEATTEFVSCAIAVFCEEK